MTNKIGGIMFKNLQKLFSIGTSGILETDIKRRIVLSNQVAFVFFIVSTPYFFIFKWMHLYSISYSVILFSGCFFTAFFFNFYRLHKTAKLILILSSNSALFFYSIALGKNSGMHLIFFALSCIPFVFYEPKEHLKKTLGLAIPIVSLAILETINYKPLLGKIDLPPTHERIIYITMIGITFTILILSIQFYYKMNYKSEQALKDAFQDLQIEKDKTELAYNKLKQSQAQQTEMANQVAYAEVVRSIAHEIKNPLHMIRGSAEVIFLKNENPQKIQKFSNIIMNTVDRLIRIMEPMMKYGRPISDLKPESLHLEFLLIEIRQLAEGNCKKKHLTLHVHSDPTLYIFADKTAFAQIMINLIVNAIQHTPEQGSITLSAIKKDDAFVEIFVTDTGIGIPKDKLSKIFDPFYSSKKESHNMGLGLSIVYKYVMENNGSISVDSQVGIGTTFCVKMPLASSQKNTKPSSSCLKGTVIFSDELF